MAANAQRKTDQSDLGLDDERLRLLIESVRDYAIFVLDPDGRVRSWNGGAERLKGYRADEIIGRHFSAFYSDDDRRAQKPEEELRQAVAHGRFEDEGWRVRKDGTRFWANVVITTLRDATGEVVGFGKVTRDLTERREAELDRLRRAEAEAAVRLRDEFLSVASHELRTPLSSLRIQADSIVRGLDKGPGAIAHERLLARMRIMQSEVGRLEALVHDLLDVTRITAGRLDLRREPVDLLALTREVVERLAEPLAHTGATILPPEGVAVVGLWDRARLEQVLVNLLTNAAKYGRGAPVTITVANEAERARLAVRDEGIGIPLEQQARIFDRFERAVDGRHFGGFGLGLWITRSIVQAHGGTVGVQSAPGAGATFVVELPKEPS